MDTIHAPVVDSHVHFWDLDRFTYEWLEDVPQLLRSFRPEDLDHPGVPIAGMIAVQADCRADQAFEEVAWYQELAARGAPILGIVAHASLDRGDGCTDDLARLSREPLVVGVRRLLQDEPPGFAVSADFVQGVRLAAQHNLVVDLCLREHQLEEVTQLVAECSEVTFVLDHLGKPAITDRQPETWSTDLHRLAEHPNVFCKLSGLATEAAQEMRNPDSLVAYLGVALRAFGPHRCLFGSDWPVAGIAMTYGSWYDVVIAAVGALSRADRDMVMSGAACSVYGVNP